MENRQKRPKHFIGWRLPGTGENLSTSIKELTEQYAPGKELTATVTDDGTHLYSVGNFISKEEADASATPSTKSFRAAPPY